MDVLSNGWLAGLLLRFTKVACRFEPDHVLQNNRVEEESNRWALEACRRRAVLRTLTNNADVAKLVAAVALEATVFTTGRFESFHPHQIWACGEMAKRRGLKNPYS
jgi:hypothetical protein